MHAYMYMCMNNVHVCLYTYTLHVSVCSKQDMIEILKDYGKQNVTIKSVARVLGQWGCGLVRGNSVANLLCSLCVCVCVCVCTCTCVLCVCTCTCVCVLIGMMANSLTGLPESVPFMVCTVVNIHLKRYF